MEHDLLRIKDHPGQAWHDLLQIRLEMDLLKLYPVHVELEPEQIKLNALY